MKNVKRFTPKFSKLLMVIIFLAIKSQLVAQVVFNDVLILESVIDPNATVVFNNRLHQTEIKAWDSSSVELQLNVKIKASKQEDIDLTLDALKNMEFIKAGSKFLITTTIWESMKSKCNTNYKLVLSNGKKVSLKEFSISITLYVPKTISMEVNSRYADIKMDEIAGGAHLKIYSGKLYGESFGEAVSMDLRYAKAYLKNIPEAKIELYDSDVEMATCGNLNLKSKYSKIEIGRTGDFIFESYDDNLSLGDLGIFKGSAKYSDFVTGTSKNLNFDFYDCNLKTGKTGDVIGQSKYGEFEIEEANKVALSSSYDDTFVFGPIASMDCTESKYTDFEIEVLKDSFKLESYDDNVSIDKVLPGFSKITINGKYGDYRLSMPEAAQYSLMIDMKYGKIDYPEEKFQRKTYINENSNIFLDAITKGSNELNSGLIEIKGYDNRIFINQ